MSDYSPHVLPSNLPYASLTAQYSPQTTVQINLRQFEKDSKAQAEREYDEEHGPLPEPPAEDDLSVDAHTRVIQKKKRKVRSAIVSRRKSAIYVEKLEAELEMRDNINADLETRLGVFRDVLQETSSRIRALQHALEVRNSAAAAADVQKRARPTTTTHPYPPRAPCTTSTDHQPPQQRHAAFFLKEDPIDDILSISPEEILPGCYPQAHNHNGAHSSAAPAHHVQAQHKTQHNGGDGDHHFGSQQQQQVQHGGMRAAVVMTGGVGHGSKDGSAHVLGQAQQHHQHHQRQQQQQHHHHHMMQHGRGSDFSSECSAADAGPHQTQQMSPVMPRFAARVDGTVSAISTRDESPWRASTTVVDHRTSSLFSQRLPYRVSQAM